MFRILPFRAGVTPRRNAWTMFAFDDEEDPNVVYQAGASGNRYLDKPEDWADYEFVWSILMGRSVPVGDWTT